MSTRWTIVRDSRGGFGYFVYRNGYVENFAFTLWGAKRVLRRLARHDQQPHVVFEYVATAREGKDG